MWRILQNRVYGQLFAAQVIALLGTGLLTVALGLLAYDLAGERAGVVLGTAFAIKMVAYVGLSPIAAALTQALPRKAVLIGADLVRAGVALLLPFVDGVVQIYLLIFVLQAASATFTPTFQAIIPDILPDEADYTRALSLSRLAYDLENLVSPALAGVLLLLVSFNLLFLGTVLGFMGSALIVWQVALPRAATVTVRPFRERLTRGIRIYLATPRLRALLALNLAVAAAGAFVLVNTIVLVRVGYEGSATDLTVALAAFGAGSMVAALSLPPMLARLADRAVMLTAAAGLAALVLGTGAVMVAGLTVPWVGFLAIWFGIGALYSAVQTPTGRLLRASTVAEDRPAIFAAQFALSHACWLLTYPLAGWAGVALGLGATMMLLGCVAAVAAGAARILWITPDGGPMAHDHPDLSATHPHLAQHSPHHAHVMVIDDLHPRWPHPA